jgi:hypothetical protein
MVYSPAGLNPALSDVAARCFGDFVGQPILAVRMGLRPMTAHERG